MPCALLTVAAMALLAVPLGNLLLSAHKQVTFLPEYNGDVYLKPAEEARYLMGLLAAALLAAATLLLAQRPPRLMPRITGALVIASQCAGVGLIVACVWAQRTVVLGQIDGFPVSAYPHGYIEPIFTIRTFLVATALAAGAVFAIKHDPTRRRVAMTLGSRRASIAVIGTLLAAIATATWVVAGVNFEDTIGNAAGTTIYNIRWPLDETFAVLDGRTPLVNLVAQYGSLWPYATAVVMSVFGATLGVFSVTMCAITGLAMLAVFALLRRLSGNAIAALLLYLPFLANSFYAIEPGIVNRYGPLTLYSLFPLRYAGPLLLAWLLARHLDGAPPRRRWLLFLAAGLVVLNNVDFGVPALGATLAATLWVGGTPRWRVLARLLRDALAGLLAAYGLVSILTLARAGSFPKLSVLFFTARLFGLSGFGLLPTPTLGFHIVIYLTYLAAVGTATVRVIRGDPGRPLTGMLVWSGIFGLGAGSYYMGRSNPGTLIAMFSAWTLALVLLALAATQQIARDPKRRLTIPHLALFLGVGVAACSLAQTPAPWTQIERLQRTAPPIELTTPALKQLLLREGHGRPEAIMNILGHRVAYEAGIVNVSPYLGSWVIVTSQQVSDTLHALHAAGGRLLVLPLATTHPNFYLAVCRAGYSFIRRVEVPNFEVEGGQPTGLTLWSAPVPGIAPRPCPVA